MQLLKVERSIIRCSQIKKINKKLKIKYYQAIVAFETGVIDNNGKPKVKKFKYIVESESVFEATQRISHYFS